VLVVLAALLVQARGDEPRLARVEDPERALALIVGRIMDVRAALADAPAWERRVYALTLTDTSDEIDQAIAWYDELASDSLAPGVDLRLTILLGEAGRHERLRHAVAQWPARGEPLATYASVMAATYLDHGELDADELGDALATLGPGWFADALALRAATHLAAPALADTARRSIETRGGPLLWRLRGLATLDLGLLIAGVVAVATARRRWPGGRRTVADAALPPPWSAGAGLATLLRGAALAALLLLLLLVGDQWLAEQPILVEALDQPLMYLPLLLLVRRGLLAPAGLGFVAAFGLWPRADGWRSWLRATAALVAAGIAIDLVLGVVAERLGLASHWVEWFDADLAWGTPEAVTVTLVASVLFAPIFEELVFRGLLYGSLRARLAWPLAALGSALVFALAHGYGAAGFLSVLLSGVLWAWAYERTGSLVPGVTAHVVNNAAVALALTALLR
jgi:uncharacterized protein